MALGDNHCQRHMVFFLEDFQQWLRTVRKAVRGFHRGYLRKTLSNNNSTARWSTIKSLAINKEAG